MKFSFSKIYEKALSLILPHPVDIEELEHMNTETFRSNVRKNNINLAKDIHALFDYKDKKVRKIVWEIKYRGNQKLTHLVASLIYEELIFILGEEDIWTNFKNPILIPIPITKKKYRNKGFNQCEEIAKSLLKLDEGRSMSLITDCLVKIRDTDSQTKKTRSERLENLKDCFSVRNPEKIHGKNIILIDDVFTTGATVYEAKRTLKDAGVKKVITIVFGH